MNTSLSENSLDNPFWRYSLRVYGRELVPPLCLELQDQYSANVNILLWACWLETEGLELSKVLLRQALDQLEPWECSVVQPLRKVRRQLKSGAFGGDVEPTRQLIKAAELKAEQQEQAWLYRLSGHAAPGRVDNLMMYTGYLALPVNSDWLQRWRRALA